jgi:hypothetical protein
MDAQLGAIHHDALQRAARRRIDVVDDMRAAKQAEERGLNQREIADILVTSQARVSRLLKSVADRPQLSDQDPEELILRAFAYDQDRRTLLEKLKKYSYSDGRVGPNQDGYIRGSWDQVVLGFAKDLLSQEEFEEIRTAVGRG